VRGVAPGSNPVVHRVDNLVSSTFREIQTFGCLRLAKLLYVSVCLGVFDSREGGYAK
jgi:hypothetical protein